jgi:hypothetical protein
MNESNITMEILDVISENVLSNDSEEVSEDIQKHMDISDEETAKLFWINTKTIDVLQSWNKNMKENFEAMNVEDDLTNNTSETFNSYENIIEEKISETVYSSTVPKLIFIVPYRDREEHLAYFKSHMKIILEDLPINSYEIYYIHQCDNRVFNRGAMKNIGFLMVKNKYPNNYKNITLVFNDVDSMPSTKNMLTYDTTPGVVKHFYGFTHTLGGIVSINAYDFEKINGYPNFWAWGYEDNMLQQRVLQAKYEIDRNIFYKITDTNIIHLNNTVLREVNHAEFSRYINNTSEGINSILNLEYSTNESSGFVDVSNFSTQYEPDISKYKMHDLRTGAMPYDMKVGLMYASRHKSRFQKKMGMIF